MAMILLPMLEVLSLNYKTYRRDDTFLLLLQLSSFLTFLTRVDSKKEF